MQKVLSHFKRLSLVDFIRKIIYYFLAARDTNLFRKAKSLFYFKTTSVIIGKSVSIIGLPFKIKAGKNVRIYNNGIFEFGSDSLVIIGDNVLFSYGVVVCCNNKIEIGNDVQIGEYTSIRDTTHVYNDNSKSMRELADVSEPVSIGNDVWIGRGCIIMPGTIIENGVVIAANSVVKGKLEQNNIYGGVPVKFIKSRF